MAENIFSWIVDKTAQILIDDDSDQTLNVMKACKEGDLNLLEIVSAAVSDVNKMKFEGDSPLGIAVEGGQLNIVKFLLKKGGDVGSANEEGHTPIQVACREGYLDIVRYLVSVGSDLHAHCPDDGLTPLMMAAKRNHLDIARYLVLEKGVELDKRNRKGVSALHYTCARGHVETARFLIHVGADVNKGDDGGWTSLHYCCYSDQLDILKNIVAIGGDVNGMDADGTTPLHVAAYNGRVGILKYLLSQGADIEKAEYNGTTILHTATERAQFEIVEYILNSEEEGTELVNRTDCDGITPLHIATRNGYTSIIDSLLLFGANVNLQAQDGRTCLHLAAKLSNGSSKPDMTQSLSKVMADYAKGALRPSQALVLMLVRSGADVDVLDNKGKTPLDYISNEAERQTIRFHIRGGVSPGTVGAPRTGNAQSGQDLSSDEADSRFELMLLRLSKEVPNTSLGDLGHALHFKAAEIKRFADTNLRTTDVTSDGTYGMLIQWYNQTSPAERDHMLIDALRSAKLLRLAENFVLSY